MEDFAVPEGFLWMEEQAEKIVAQLAAHPLQLPDGLEFMQADFKGETVTMRSRAWQTKTFKVIRETVLYYPGKLRSFNFVIYPHLQFSAPIFATDFIALAGKLRIGLVDAMPLFSADSAYKKEWISPFMPLQRAAAQLSKQYDRKLNWSLKYTGEAACLATEAEGDQIGEICQLWLRYLSLYLEKCENLAPADRATQAEVANWHQHYNAEHLAVENSRNPFMTYFGETLGRRFNEEFLFADEFGS